MDGATKRLSLSLSAKKIRRRARFFLSFFFFCPKRGEASVADAISILTQRTKVSVCFEKIFLVPRRSDRILVIILEHRERYFGTFFRRRPPDSFTQEAQKCCFFLLPSSFLVVFNRHRQSFCNNNNNLLLLEMQQLE